ncbi:hypothetical protein HUO13_09390 [Saccharopolyspora erythraea]|uniref:hypothetical protein n=1 Tax=Saccharopolyspora erythraea TaxID=1836 RepID=UPI001BAD9CF3|nr:hypothetical protein [Saccharopolyspora erythraea]QUH01008.1 hypothetical protein HUO13_09390 [Saccharopolyspora erythraea]
MNRFTADRVAATARLVWLTARVVEQRRFEYLFAEGSAEAVRAALDPYRCADGGFGYALEPDSRGPVSQPLHTWTALEMLTEIDAAEGPVVSGAIDYLVSITRPDGGVPGVDPSLRPYPHAPWMPIDDEPPGALLTTALLAGTLHRNKIEHPWLDRAGAFCWDRIDALGETHPYEVQAALHFLDHVPERQRAASAAQRLGTLVREQRLVVLDPARPEDARVAPGYAPGELHHVYDYARTPESLGCSWFSGAELARGLDHLADQQEEDGGWPVRWREWAPGAHLEARPRVAIEALLTLRAHD